MSQLGVILQDSESSNNNSNRATILWFLREQMDVSDESRGRRKSLKERLGFKGMGCCGTTWGFSPTSDELREAIVVAEEQHQERRRIDDDQQLPAGQDRDPDCSDPDPGRDNPVSTPSMNLAAALAAERQFRAWGEETIAPATPTRVSLMRLLEETDGGDEARGVMGSDTVCCVCMGRKKGAAFIPCGHTFCRVCSRELWLNRGTCPLCNRPILEILDIF